jgi:metal-sulfur cluster biosynthetic enzyme
MATGTATEDDVYEALEEVIDPELGLDFVSLGLVYDIEIESDEAYITFTLTTPACPIGPQVSEQMREFVGQLEGINKVHPKMVFDPPWSPEMMSEDAKSGSPRSRAPCRRCRCGRGRPATRLRRQPAQRRAGSGRIGPVR